MTSGGANSRDQLEEKVGALAVALLGALGEALDKTPEKVAEVSRGIEARLRTARTLGEFSVAFGKHETAKRVGQVAQYAEQLRKPLEKAIAQALGLADDPKTVAPAPAVDLATPNSNSVDSEPGDPNQVLPDYDTLTASQILALVEGLAISDAEILLRYESTHRNRKTVIARLSAIVSA